MVHGGQAFRSGAIPYAATSASRAPTWDMHAFMPSTNADDVACSIPSSSRNARRGPCAPRPPPLRCRSPCERWNCRCWRSVIFDDGVFDDEPGRVRRPRSRPRCRRICRRRRAGHEVCDRAARREVVPLKGGRNPGGPDHCSRRRGPAQSGHMLLMDVLNSAVMTIVLASAFSSTFQTVIRFPSLWFR